MEEHCGGTVEKSWWNTHSGRLKQRWWNNVVEQWNSVGGILIVEQVKRRWWNSDSGTVWWKSGTVWVEQF